MNRALVIQTAFLGDVVLTLPLVQVLKRAKPEISIDVVVIPSTKDVVETHPDVASTIVYDKHGRQKSIGAFMAFARSLRERKYDVVICPHRSLRSSLLARWTMSPVRIGFDASAMTSSFTSVLSWRFGIHDVDRNLSLLSPLGILCERETPKLFPTQKNREEVDAFLRDNGISGKFAAIAPGTVWKTKQYPVGKMREVAQRLLERFKNVAIVGGESDVEISRSFEEISPKIKSAAGKFSIMSSAELIRRASVLVSNDSAPVHIASAFNVPTVAIFGPTVTGFGFYPYGDRSAVEEMKGMSCRPCAIHGGEKCPIGSFDCMEKILPGEIVKKAIEVAGAKNG